MIRLPGPLERMDPRHRRLLALGLAALILLVAGILFLLDTPSESERVEAALNDLVHAVERKEPDLLAQRIDETYHGWGQDQRTVVEFYTSVKDRYENANVTLQNVVIAVDHGDRRAVATFEWSSSATIVTELYGRVDTSLLGAKFIKATTEFVRGEDGQWRLSNVKTIFPIGEPRPGARFTE